MIFEMVAVNECKQYDFIELDHLPFNSFKVTNLSNIAKKMHYRSIVAFHGVDCSLQYEFKW